MLHRPDEFTAFVHEPPAVEIRSGIAYLRYGCGGPERAMSVQTLQRAVERGQRAIKRYTSGERTVIVDD